MCKCSFVRVAWLLAAWLALAASAQEYNVNEPTGDVVFNSKYIQIKVRSVNGSRPEVLPMQTDSPFSLSLGQRRISLAHI